MLLQRMSHAQLCWQDLTLCSKAYALSSSLRTCCSVRAFKVAASMQNAACAHMCIGAPACTCKHPCIQGISTCLASRRHTLSYASHGALLTSTSHGVVQVSREEAEAEEVARPHTCLTVRLRISCLSNEHLDTVGRFDHVHKLRMLVHMSCRARMWGKTMALSYSYEKRPRMAWHSAVAKVLFVCNTHWAQSWTMGEVKVHNA